LIDCTRRREGREGGANLGRSQTRRVELALRLLHLAERAVAELADEQPVVGRVATHGANVAQLLALRLVERVIVRELVLGGTAREQVAEARDERHVGDALGHAANVRRRLQLGRLRGDFREK